MFAQRLSATPRGARLARRLALRQLETWGIPHGVDASDAVGLVVAELAANAVTHGRVPGRDFELRLSLVTGSVRIEGDRRPQRPAAAGASRRTVAAGSRRARAGTAAGRRAGLPLGGAGPVAVPRQDRPRGDRPPTRPPQPCTFGGRGRYGTV
ncbi:LOW QUALITY PROTEIN: regulatory protein, partial [Streptomyces sp. e14]